MADFQPIPAHYKTDKAVTVEPAYWAAQSTRKAVSEAIQRRDEYYMSMNNTNGRRNLMRQCWIYYNISHVLGGRLIQAGAKGQFMLFYVNYMRELLEHQIQFVVSARPAWEPKATTSDAQSLIQTRLARNILDHYMRLGAQDGLEDLFYRAVEFAAVLGEGFIEMYWDQHAGRVLKSDDDGYADMLAKTGYDPTNKDPKNVVPVLRSGDIKYHVYSGMDVIRDPNAKSWAETSWRITRRRVNKYDLAARYPEKATQILATSEDTGSVPNNFYYNWVKLPYKSDLIWQYRFWHDKTEAVPEGREILFLHNATILEDKRELGYSKVPLFRIAGGETDGTSNGYCKAFDLCSLQENLNAINSAITSNIKAYGINNIIAPLQSRINEARLPEGLNMIELAGQSEIKVLELLKIAPEMFNYSKQIKEDMAVIVGVPSAVRGGTGDGASGSAQAIQTTNATEFNQTFQTSYTSCVEGTGTMTLEVFKNYVKVPLAVDIIGEGNAAYQALITGDKIKNITRVVADVSDPQSKTIQGRFQRAQLLSQTGDITKQEMMNVLMNGRLDPADELGESQEITIQAENEMLDGGVTTPPIITDDHMEHLRLHGKAVADLLATPTARAKVLQSGLDANGQPTTQAASPEFKAYKVYKEHIDAHLAMLQPQAYAEYATLSAAMGQSPPPQAAPPPGEGAPPGAPPGPAPGSPKEGGKPKQPAQPPGRPSTSTANFPDLPGSGPTKVQFQPGSPPPPTGG